jgi:hypothetical protein
LKEDGDAMKFRILPFIVVMGLGIILLTGGNSGNAAEKGIYQKDPESCAKCHMIKPYVETWKNSDFLAHKHQKAGVGCLECHQVTPQQQKDHLAKSKKKSYKTPLEEREYGSEVCFRCHGSYKDLIERTKDFKDRGLAKNPHKSHYGEIDCNMCHKAHRTSVDYCSQCHQPGMSKPGWKTL